MVLVARSPWTRDPLPNEDAIAEARRVLEAAALREPANARWSYGLGHTARIESRRLTGDAAAARRKQSKESFQKAAQQEPANPDYQYWSGNSCFEMIDDVGFFSKGSLASTGRKGFEKAIEIDPNHVSAHYALGIFFMKAPGIAGGSTAKAKAEGEALLRIPGGRGEFWGHFLLAQIAAGDKDWAGMSAHYTAAETAKGEGPDALLALQAQIGAFLNLKKDPASALPVLERFRAASKPDDTIPDFYEGEIRRQLGQWEQAVAAYQRVLAKNPEARNTRYGIAQCYEKLGRKADAKREYDEFVRRFPTDERAAKAKEASRRLG